MLKVALEVASWGSSQPVYIHCANGRGRSLCFAAIVMALRQGGAQAIDDIIAGIKKDRPQVHAMAAQRSLTIDVLRLHNSSDGGESIELANRADSKTELDGSVDDRSKLPSGQIVFEHV